MADLLGKLIDAVVLFEVGGLNTPVIMPLAACFRIPTVDGYALGRSTPETQMTSFLGHGISLTPMPLVDRQRNAVVVLSQESPTYAEELGRWIVARGGGLCDNSHYTTSGAELKRVVLPKTISQALQIGHIVLQSRKSVGNPVVAASRVLNGRLLHVGRIQYMTEKQWEGFYLTTITSEGTHQYLGKSAELNIMNEAMILEVNSREAVIFPDLICLLPPVTARGLMSTDLCHGMEIATLGCARLPQAKQDGKPLLLPVSVIPIWNTSRRKIYLHNSRFICQRKETTVAIFEYHYPNR